MKYNKYALSLLLFVSSAFASFTFDESKLNLVAANIKTAIGKKQNPSKCINSVKNILTKKQQEEFLKISNLQEVGAIRNALKEAAKEDEEGYVKFIVNKVKGITDPGIDLSFYETADSEAKVQAIKEFSTLEGGWQLDKSEIEAYVLGGPFPAKLSQVDKILKIADSGKVSDKAVGLYGADLNSVRYNAIQRFENILSRAINEAELKDYLEEGKLLPYTIAQRLDAIKALPAGKVGETTEILDYATSKQIEVIKAKEAEFNKRIENDLLETILNTTNDAELDLLARTQKQVNAAKSIDDKVTFIMTLPAESDVAAYEGHATDDQVAAIKKREKGGKKIAEATLRGILDGTITGDEAAPNPVPVPAPAEKDLATKVFELVNGNRIEESSRDQLKALKLTDDEITKLVNTQGLSSKEEVQKALDKIRAPAPPAKDLYDNILALVNNKRILEASRPQLKGLGLTDDEITKLVAVENLATKEDVKKALDNIRKSASEAVPADAAAQILALAAANGNKLDAGKHEEALKKLNFNADQIKALLAATSLSNEAEVKAAIDSASKPKPRTPADIAAEVFSKYVVGGKVDQTKKAELEALQITADQIDKLFKATGLDVAAIEDILKSKEADKLNYDAILAIATANSNKFVEASREALKSLGLKPEQIDLLLKASGLDTVDKIKEVLSRKTTGNSEDVKGKTNTSGETSTEAAKDSWYTNPWILGIGGIFIVAAVGGGAYMMTRKTDETDL